MKLLFATNNPNKFQEVKAIVPSSFELLSLTDVGFNEPIEEPYDTIAANSLHKAQYVHEKTGLSCFAEDTGLSVRALNGKPGVYSARYAGLHATAADNIGKLLTEMEGIMQRDASFITTLTFIEKNVAKQFEGILNGRIAAASSGNGGFGYDPAFIPENYEQTLAELPLEVKLSESHRSKAFGKFKEYLQHSFR